MKLTISLIISFFALGFSANAQHKVAIYIKNSSLHDKYGSYGMGASDIKELTSLLINDLLQTDQYQPIERDADFLSAIEQENDYQTSGEVSEEQIISIGKKYGAKYVISGDYSLACGTGGSYKEANLRALDVENGLIISSISGNNFKNRGYFKEDLSKKFIAGFPIQFSGTPKHLSLCTTKDGKRYYIKPSQWQAMSERKKEDYNIIGICIIWEGERFILNLHDSGKGDWDYAKANNACTLSQLQLIESLNSDFYEAMRIFGGVLPRARYLDDFYWTSDEIDSGKSWGIKQNNEPKKFKKKTIGLIRKAWNL